MARGYRLRVYVQGDDSTVDHTFYAGVSGQTSELHSIPDVADPAPEPFTGRLRSRNTTFELASETIPGTLGDGEGRLDWVGRLVDWSVSDDDGSTWAVVWGGRVAGGPGENDGPGKQALLCQDENWLNRRQPLFPTAGPSTMLYPPGLVTAWANIEATPVPTWQVVSTATNWYKVMLFSQYPVPPGHTGTFAERYLSRELAAYLMADVVASPVSNRNDGQGNFTFLRFYDDDAATDRPILSFSTDPALRNFVGDLRDPDRTIKQVWVYEASHTRSPGEVINGYVRASGAPPDPMNPRHIGGALGQDLGEFLEDVVDGTFGGDAARYDNTVALATWNESTNPEGLKANPELPRVQVDHGARGPGVAAGQDPGPAANRDAGQQ